MVLTIGKRFEVEVGRTFVFLRVGEWERCWNTRGLASH